MFDDEKAKAWLRNLQDVPLPPDDPRYQSFHEAGAALRGFDPVDPFFDRIVLRDDQASCQLFSGFRGTGKSTELRRLAALLEAEGYVVLLEDAGEYHDLQHDLVIEDLLVMIGAAFGKATAARCKDATPPEEGYLSRLGTFLAGTELVLAGGKGAGLSGELRHGRPFWLKVRDCLGGALGTLQDNLADYIELCISRLAEAEPEAKGVVFLFDSLERLSGPAPVIAQVMLQVSSLFVQYSEFLRLPGCHAIYTLPPYVDLLQPSIQDCYDGRFFVLPAVKVVQRGPSAEPYRPGLEHLTSMLEHRVPVREIFGDEGELLNQVILASGGHLRRLLKFVEEVIICGRRAGLPATEALVHRAIQPFRESAQNSIRKSGVSLLERIRRQESLVGIEESELAEVATYLDNFLVLCYRNGEGWYEVHPLIRDHVARLASERNASSEN